jgi:hypothetical protein
MRPLVIAAIAVAGGLSLVPDGASAQWRIPEGNDNLMPRYYDYRAPRAYYWDGAPVAFGAYGYSYLPPAVYPAPPVYGAPAYGYGPPVARAPQAVAPSLPVAPRPICGVYRYWNGERCLDARGY